MGKCLMRNTLVRRRTVAALAAIVTLAALAACAEPNAAPKASGGKAGATVATVRVGIGSDPATAVYVVAHSKGFFEKNGIKSELRQFASGGEAVGAQVSGEIDLTSVTEPPFIAAYSKGAALSVLGTIATSDHNFGAVGRPGISSAKDLTRPDVKVGVTQNSGAHYFLQRYAEANGISLKDMQLKYLQVSDLVASFSRGDIQAMFTWTPNVQQAVKTVPGSKIFAYSGDVGFPTTMYVVATKEVSGNAKTSKAVMESLVEASQWISAHPAEALQLLSDTFHVPSDALRLPMSVFKYQVNLTQEQVKSFASVAAWMKDSGLITKVPSSDFVNAAPLRSVDSKLVSTTP